MHWPPPLISAAVATDCKFLGVGGERSVGRGAKMTMLATHLRLSDPGRTQSG